MLSETARLVVSMVVSVPLTVKLPPTIKPSVVSKELKTTSEVVPTPRLLRAVGIEETSDKLLDANIAPDKEA